MAVLRRISEETPLPIRQINPAIPAWLEEVVAILQAKDPDMRFSSANEGADLCCISSWNLPLRQPSCWVASILPR
jgi:serine/threonine-protein kinase